MHPSDGGKENMHPGLPPCVLLGAAFKKACLNPEAEHWILAGWTITFDEPGLPFQKRIYFDDA